VQPQETITNATANLFGITATVLIAIAGVVALAFGVDQLTDLVEVRVPVRQLMAGRSLQALTLSCRIVCTLVVSCITARLTPCEGVA
jgi:electron transfer flavoprotein alpha subunit